MVVLAGAACLPLDRRQEYLRCHRLDVFPRKGFENPKSETTTATTSRPVGTGQVGGKRVSKSEVSDVVKRSKRYRETAKLVERDRKYEPAEAVSPRIGPGGVAWGSSARFREAARRGRTPSMLAGITSNGATPCRC